MSPNRLDAIRETLLMGPGPSAVYPEVLRALGRPTFFPMPAFAARLAFGEMADALLLSSTRVQPERLSGSAYKFRDERLDATLQRLVRYG